jgi:hypothetical protein
MHYPAELCSNMNLFIDVTLQDYYRSFKLQFMLSRLLGCRLAEETLYKYFIRKPIAFGQQKSAAVRVAHIMGFT